MTSRVFEFSPHPLLTDAVRLKIMSVLATSLEPVSFGQLIETLQVTKGNLSTHISKLEEAGMVNVKKQFLNKKPLTTYECSQLGRKTVADYLAQVQALLANAKSY